MSFHKSKGLTAQVVVLAGLVEGLMPFAARAGQSPKEQQAAIDEQRRLLYVGLTRTTETLVLSSYVRLPAATAQRLGVARRWIGDGYATQASRYLHELGGTAPTAVDGNRWRYR
jgi:superfamily I DNA/RNA helicase